MNAIEKLTIKMAEIVCGRLAIDVKVAGRPREHDKAQAEHDELSALLKAARHTSQASATPTARALLHETAEALLATCVLSGTSHERIHAALTADRTAPAGGGEPDDEIAAAWVVLSEPGLTVEAQNRLMLRIDKALARARRAAAPLPAVPAELLARLPGCCVAMNMAEVNAVDELLRLARTAPAAPSVPVSRGVRERAREVIQKLPSETYDWRFATVYGREAGNAVADALVIVRELAQ